MAELTRIFRQALPAGSGPRIANHRRRGVQVLCGAQADLFVWPASRAAAPEVLAVTERIDFTRYRRWQAAVPARWQDLFLQLCEAGGGLTPIHGEDWRGQQPLCRYTALMRSATRGEVWRALAAGVSWKVAAVS